MRYKNWKAQTKIFVSVTICASILAVLGFRIYLLNDRLINEENVLTSSSEKMTIQAYKLKEIEEEIVSSIRFNEDFFEIEKDERRSEFEDAYSTLGDILSSIMKDELIIENEKSHRVLEEIEAASSKYYDNLMLLVEKIRKRGHKNYGIIGSMRSEVHRVEEHLSALPESDNLMISLLQIRRSEKDYLLRKEIEYADLLKEQASDFVKLLENSPMDIAVKAQMNEQMNSYIDQFNTMIKLDEVIGRDDESGLLRKNRAEMESLIYLFEELNEEVAVIVKGELIDLRNSIRVIFLVLIMIAISMGIYLTKTFKGPIVKFVSLLGVAETGDLTVMSDLDTEDEFGRLAMSFNRMVYSHKKTILKVIEAGETLKSSAEVSSSSSEQMAALAQNQSLKVKELNKAMGEMVKSISEIVLDLNGISENIGDVNESSKKLGKASDGIAVNTERVTENMTKVIESLNELNKTTEIVSLNAEKANEEAKATVAIASEGKITVGNTIAEIEIVNQAMEELQEVIKALGKAAMHIEDIVEVIADIAEQTNLLSLNASIEAARAGDYGKGFAVVADAIGKLAEKSGESTKDISDLIGKIKSEVSLAMETTAVGAQKVQVGVKMVRNTGTAFDGIYQAISKTTAMIGEIALSTNEQLLSSNDIMNAINAVNDISVAVASAVEEQVISINDVSTTIERLEESAGNITELTLQQSATTQEVLSNVEEIDHMTRDEAKACADVAKTAERLTGQARELMEAVRTFKVE